MAVQWTDGGEVKRGPSWEELVDEATRQLGFEDPRLARVRGTDLQILEYYHARHHNFAQLTNWLVRLQPPDNALQTSAIHTELVNLTNSTSFYTTNFDDYLERAFDLNGRPYRRVAVEAHLAEPSPADGCDIVKFHGDLNFPEGMVLSESQYEERLKLRTALDYRLRADVLGRALLFIGYSFRDWNVAYLFRLVNDEFGPLPEAFNGRRAYIVVSDPADFEQRLFARRNIEVIPVSSANRERDIADLLSQMRSS